MIKVLTKKENTKGPAMAQTYSAFKDDPCSSWACPKCCYSLGSVVSKIQSLGK